MRLCRPRSYMIRNALFTVNCARHASSRSSIANYTALEHGREIFVFNHLQTNQVVYSLTRALNNNDALKQIPYNGKKTVPRALRKDLWAPFAVLQFPTFASEVGLSVYQRLREYKHLHEVLWDESIRYEEKEGRINTLSVRERSRKLMNQKANSIADMAAVLGLLSTPTKIDEEVNGEEIDTGAKVGVLPAYEGNVGVVGERSGINVTIKWRDTLDAEFASEWTGNVVHEVMEQRFNVNNLTLPSPAERWEEEREDYEEELQEENELNETDEPNEAGMSKKARAETHSKFMETSKGKQQDYKSSTKNIAEGKADKARARGLASEERKQQNIKSSTESAQAQNNESRHSSSSISNANASLLQELGVPLQKYVSKPRNVKKTVVTSPHVALMNRLRGEAEDYVPQSRAAAKRAEKKRAKKQAQIRPHVALTEKLRGEPQERPVRQKKQKVGISEHEALMARLKGTHQSYTPRGKKAVREIK
ncbi:hypothetical protein B7494_g5186 [Chlorociboria aeruginascens]|nr:hypothetical protein B7494_g5186 [Chlorociboria aeruginascens]